jgi:hypothetical protein
VFINYRKVSYWGSFLLKLEASQQGKNLIDRNRFLDGVDTAAPIRRAVLRRTTNYNFESSVIQATPVAIRKIGNSFALQRLVGFV